jgi:hypothetical protein
MIPFSLVPKMLRRLLDHVRDIARHVRNKDQPKNLHEEAKRHYYTLKHRAHFNPFQGSALIVLPPTGKYWLPLLYRN